MIATNYSYRLIVVKNLLIGSLGGMINVTEIRKLNLKRLELKYGSQVILAEVLDESTARINHLLTGQRNIGEKTARKFEERLKKPMGWMDHMEEDFNEKSKNTVDLSKYTEDQKRLIKILLDSFDAALATEHPPESRKTLLTNVLEGSIKLPSEPNPSFHRMANKK